MAESADDKGAGADWRSKSGRTLIDRISERSLGMFTAWAGDSAWRRAGLLTLLCLALFIPGQMALGPTERDESRFIQASKQMLETGDYVDIRLLDSPRHKKPVGVYWAQTASVHAVETVNGLLGEPLGDVRTQVWVYRIPSLLGALLATLLTAWAVRPLIGPRAAFLAGAMVAGLLVVNVEARIAKTDALLLAAVVLAMGALARIWFGRYDDATTRGWNVFYLWTALAIGVLLKGPIIFLPVIGAVVWMLILTRDAAPLRRMGWSWGPVWLLLLAAPWFIAIAVKTDGAFFMDSLVKDLAGKVAKGVEGKGAPPGVHLVAFWGVFWPWTPLALMALPWVWGWRKAPETAFLLGWIIPTWIIFELTPTKLAHYTMPTFPAICALAAAAVLDGGVRAKGALFWIGALLWAVPAVALPIAFVAGPLLLEPGLASPERWAALGPPVLFSALAMIVLFQAWRWLLRGVWIGFVRAALVGAGLLYVSAFQFSLPSMPTLFVSNALHDRAAPLRACAAARLQTERAPLAVSGYNEASLPFLAGTDTLQIDPGGALNWMLDAPGRMAWVESRSQKRFDEIAAERGVAIRTLAEARGFNYSNGKWLSFRLTTPDGPGFATAFAHCPGAPKPAVPEADASTPDAPEN